MGRGKGLMLIKRPENKTPREELLLKDVSQMFWELRELRQEIADLKAENTKLRRSNSNLENSNMKLRYENAIATMSNMYQ